MYDCNRQDRIMLNLLVSPQNICDTYMCVIKLLKEKYIFYILKDEKGKLEYKALSTETFLCVSAHAMLKIKICPSQREQSLLH